MRASTGLGRILHGARRAVQLAALIHLDRLTIGIEEMDRHRLGRHSRREWPRDLPGPGCIRIAHRTELISPGHQPDPVPWAASTLGYRGEYSVGTEQPLDP